AWHAHQRPGLGWQPQHVPPGAGPCLQTAGVTAALAGDGHRPDAASAWPCDLSGHLLAYLSLSPIFVIIGFVTLIIFKRELHTVSLCPPAPSAGRPLGPRAPALSPPVFRCVSLLAPSPVSLGGPLGGRGPQAWAAQLSARLPPQISFLGGLALNEGVNWLIKHVIQEPRPCGGPHAAVGTKYGMPSSHSQFMWFFSVYSFLFLYLRMHQTNNARFLDLLWRHLLSLGLLTAAFLVSYSRVYLLYHTWSQVLYGGVAGSLMAVAWFVFTQEVLTPLFPRIAAW
uniref:Dolichyldiphosphatase n=1 Tax=Oryctolagus cuniculus TaxID=9986 RepID=A0A5F9DCW3_RABIT